ncbi:hypothetical protein STEG23_016020 [Scotinomys teguina]
MSEAYLLTSRVIHHLVHKSGIMPKEFSLKPHLISEDKISHCTWSSLIQVIGVAEKIKIMAKSLEGQLSPNCGLGQLPLHQQTRAFDLAFTQTQGSLEAGGKSKQIYGEKKGEEIERVMPLASTKVKARYQQTGLYVSLCVKLKSKWIKDLNTKPDTLNIMEEKVENGLENIGTGDNVLNRTLTAQVYGSKVGDESHSVLYSTSSTTSITEEKLGKHWMNSMDGRIDGWMGG